MTPKGWQIRRLGDVLKSIEAGWSPQCMTYPAPEHEWGVLKVSAVTTGSYLDTENKSLPKSEHPRQALEVQTGDLLLARANGVLDLVGRTAYVYKTRSQLMISDKILRLRPIENLADGLFLHLILSSRSTREALASVTGGSHMRNVSQESLRRLVIPIPPLPEQRKIAAILSAVDAVIERTQAVLDQLQQAKKALMQELLTRGIPGRHTRFKQTEIGEVPEGWKVVTIEDIAPRDRSCAQTGPFGEQLRPEDFTESGIPVLKIGNVRWGYIDLTDISYVSARKAEELSNFKIESGDLLFARQGATTGRNALADEKCVGAIINYHLIRVAINKEVCDPRYLSICFNSDLIQKQVGQNKQKGNRDGINTQQIKKFSFPLPAIKEQMEIADSAGSIDACIASNISSLEQLKRTKSALMSVLLSGEVRVKVKEGAA